MLPVREKIPHVVVRILFAKTGDLQYISHLDLHRAFTRMLVRAGVPLRPEWTENYPDADGFFRVYVNGVFAGMGEKTETGEIRFRAMLLPPINETLPK